MPSFLTDMKVIGYLATEELHPEGVGHFVAEYIRDHQGLLGDEQVENAEEHHPCDKAAKGLVCQQSMLD